jgi:hypothetical protein
MSSRQTAVTMAIRLGLFALAIFIGYIVWIGIRF